MKITFIGTGKVGGLAVQYTLQKKLGDSIIVNRSREYSEGFILDTVSAIPDLHSNVHLGDFSDTKDSDIIVITAGPVAKAGQKLSEFSRRGKQVIKSIVDKSDINPAAVVILITTPVDETAQYFQTITHHPKNKVLGFGGSLDVSRLKYLLSKETGKIASEIVCYYVGKHGAQGIPVFDEKVTNPDELTRFSKYYFSEVAQRTGSSTLYGPAYQLAELIEAVANDTQETFGVSTWHPDHKIFVTWPCVIGSEGVIEMVKIKLTKTQQREWENLIDLERTSRQSTQ